LLPPRPFPKLEDRIIWIRSVKYNTSTVIVLLMIMMTCVWEVTKDGNTVG